MNTAQELAAEHCRPLSEEALLVDAEVGRLLKAVPGWERQGNEIQRTHSFKDFYETMAFVNAVAWIANQEDHHPDLDVRYAACRVRYTTHSAGGLTRNDFVCAARIDTLRAADEDAPKG